MLNIMFRVLASRAKNKAQCVICFFFSLTVNIPNYQQGHSFPGTNLKQKFIMTIQLQFLAYDPVLRGRVGVIGWDIIKDIL